MKTTCTFSHHLASLLTAGALFFPLSGLPAKAQEVPANNEKVNESLRLATQFFLSKQDEKRGCFASNDRKENALTSLAVLALAGIGHQPADPTPEGRAMKRALDYVLAPESQDKDGYFGGKDGSRMYGHGITSLMLAEMVGMGADVEQDEKLRKACRRAIDLILRAQRVPKDDRNRGGWRYTPDSPDSDMSVTVWQTMALRAARNAGLDVPRESIEDAVRYIKRSYQPDDERKGAKRMGGFGYMGKGRELSTTSEGLLALLVCGEYEADEVKGAAERLFKEGLRRDERWFFYTTYYYAQSMYQRGGQYAVEGKRTVADTLLPMQSREGWWEGNGGEEKQGGKIYATALAVLSLTVKNHFLPIYQR